MTFNCPSCYCHIEVTIEVASDVAEMDVQCPQCSSTITVPHPGDFAEPLLCCLCNERNAKVHLTYLGGEPKKAKVIERIDLCEECARKHQVNPDEAGFSTADLFSAVEKARRSPKRR